MYGDHGAGGRTICRNDSKPRSKTVDYVFGSGGADLLFNVGISGILSGNAEHVSDLDFTDYRGCHQDDFRFGAEWCGTLSDPKRVPKYADCPGSFLFFL